MKISRSSLLSVVSVLSTHHMSVCCCKDSLDKEASHTCALMHTSAGHPTRRDLLTEKGTTMWVTITKKSVGKWKQTKNIVLLYILSLWLLLSSRVFTYSIYTLITNKYTDTKQNTKLPLNASPTPNQKRKHKTSAQHSTKKQQHATNNKKKKKNKLTNPSQSQPTLQQQENNLREFERDTMMMKPTTTNLDALSRVPHSKQFFCGGEEMVCLCVSQDKNKSSAGRVIWKLESTQQTTQHNKHTRNNNKQTKCRLIGVQTKNNLPGSRHFIPNGIRFKFRWKNSY